MEEVVSSESPSRTIGRFPGSRAFDTGERVGDTQAVLHRLRLFLFLALLVSLVGCRSARHTVEPYRSDLEAANSLETRANVFCASRRPANPPHMFVTDGCSMFPDSDWVECCVEHDIEYWCGGTADERRLADRALQACVAKTGRPTLGWWMDKGVRMGGVPWAPTSWRWGYGWNWPTGYADESKEGKSSAD